MYGDDTMAGRIQKSGLIQVSSKTLGHISAGLYRSPASALKELVSNSFDADASTVNITTNRPSFDVVTCSDDGDGMTIDSFIALMEGGIGASDKRRGPPLTKRGRPVIGRIGIGLLALAQICHEFQVISHHRESKAAFRATVRLVDYLQETIDETESAPSKVYEVGEYECSSIEYNASAAGMSVVASDVKRGFVKRFREHGGPPVPRDFKRFVTDISTSSKRSVRMLGDYPNMIWGLSIACPIHYLKEGPVVGKQVLPKIKQALLDYKFEVLVDGVHLRKPILLPNPVSSDEEKFTYNVFNLSEDSQVYGQKLKFAGYIFAQGGKSLYPAELRGILVRIKNVAIGTYDPSLLGYPIAEGPRFGWLSGEIYVEDGLEDALNVDRDSFNEMHPHYISLQESLHRKLQNEVFPKVIKGISIRREYRQERQREEHEERFSRLVSTVLEKPYQIELSKARLTDRVLIDDTTGKIIVDNTASWPTPQNRREIAQRIAIAYRLSERAGSTEDQHKMFYTLLQEIFRIW